MKRVPPSVTALHWMFADVCVMLPAAVGSLRYCHGSAMGILVTSILCLAIRTIHHSKLRTPSNLACLRRLNS